MAQITFKGTAVHTSGKLPAVGAQAPDFKLVKSDLSDCSLRDFRGKRKLISIVPSLDTQVCFISTKKFNEQIQKHPEVMVLVVSADLPFAQGRICGAENLKNVIPLSMMRSKDFARDYGILIQDGPLAGLAARSVVVLDDNDKVLYTELVPELTNEPNYNQALKALLY